MTTGKVRWFDDAKGLGFITPDDGNEDLFVSFSITNMSDVEPLHERQKVSFDVMQDCDGKQASNIQLVSYSFF